MPINLFAQALKSLWYGLLTLLLLLMLGLSAINSSALTAISIQLIDGKADHLDKRIPLLTRNGEEQPDYRVDYQVNDRWHSAGTLVNQSAKQWLNYPITKPPNLKFVQAIRVVEDDLTKDDLLDQVPATQTEITGNQFQYRLETEYSIDAAMEWFASTPLGMAILGGVFLAVFLVILVNLGDGV
jgi:hypothetical protein